MSDQPAGQPRSRGWDDEMMDRRVMEYSLQTLSLLEALYAICNGASQAD